MKLNRTFGIEVEGYSRNFAELRKEVEKHDFVFLKYDASLRNAGYSYYSRQPAGVSVGVEVVTSPLDDLSMLDKVFDIITTPGWNVGRTRAGTHVHIDARDYTVYDMAKVGLLAYMLSDILFMLVKPYREGNRYCAKPSTIWKKYIELMEHDETLMAKAKSTNIVYEAVSGVNNNSSVRLLPIITRYSNINIIQSFERHNTIEFRLFHAIRTAKEAKQMVIMSHNIIDTLKTMELEQVKYSIDTILSKRNALEAVETFAEIFHLPFIPKIINKNLAKTYDLHVAASRAAM